MKGVGNRKSRWIIGFLCLVGLCLQSTSAEAREKERRQGWEASSFVVVMHFYDAVASRHRDADRWEYFLSRVEMEPGSPPAQVLTRAMFEAQALFAEKVTLPAPDDENFTRVQHDHLRRNVRGLSKIWRAMRRDIVGRGGDLEPIDRFIEEKIVPGTVLITWGSDSGGKAILEEFDADLRLEETLPEGGLRGKPRLQRSYCS